MKMYVVVLLCAACVLAVHTDSAEKWSLEGHVVTWDGGSGYGLMIVQAENRLVRLVYDVKHAVRNSEPGMRWQLGMKVHASSSIPLRRDPNGDAAPENIAVMPSSQTDALAAAAMVNRIERFVCKNVLEHDASIQEIPSVVKDLIEGARSRGVHRQLTCNQPGHVALIRSGANRFQGFIGLADYSSKVRETLMVAISTTPSLKVTEAKILNESYTNYLLSDERFTLSGP